MTVLLDSAAMAEVHRFKTAAEFHAAMLNTLGGNAADTTAAVEAAAQAAVNPTDLEEFCNVCGADKGVARTFLARYGNNADAMSAFFDNGGVLPPVEEGDADAAGDAGSPSADAGSSSSIAVSQDDVEILQVLCGTDADTARAFLVQFGNVAAAERSFIDNSGVLPDEASGGSAFGSGSGGGGGGSASADGGESLRARAAAQSYVMNKRFKVALEFNSMLHLVSSFVEVETAIAGMIHWSSSTSIVSSGSDGNEIDTDAVLKRIAEADSKQTLDRLGSLLTHMFVNEAELLKDPRAPQATAAAGAGAGAEATSAAVPNAPSRQVPKPGEGARNRHDLVGVVTKSDTDERSVPIWVTCADSTSGVIDVVLSVYLRRGRLPEPGEILFCTADTSLEDIEILLRRFLKARNHGRDDAVFCLADVHALVYTKQCAVVDMLQELLAEHGHQVASNLLIVSGKQRQVVLNSLSQYSLECPPLDAAALQKACTRAFETHCGETVSVTADINGSGKTRSIMCYAAQKQAQTAAGEKMLLYRRLPIREASTAASVLAVLSNLPELEDHVVHVDVGHIIPGCANTLLFELLIVGTIRDTVNCKVYHRRREDVFMLEVPNSIDDKTAVALRIAALLPQQRIVVSPENLQFDRPQFCNAEGTLVEMVQDRTIKFVCKFLRALKNRVFDTQSENYNLTFQPEATSEQTMYINQLKTMLEGMGMPLSAEQVQAWLVRCDWHVDVAMGCIFDGQEAPAPAVIDSDITPEECFALLIEYGSSDAADNAAAGGIVLHNFATLRSFVRFVYPMFRSITEWPMINTAALGGEFIQNHFKQSFMRMLLATARDFTGRSVPQGNQLRLEQDQIGWVPPGNRGPARVASGGGGGRIGRALSGSQEAASDTDAHHVMRQGSLDGGPPPADPLTAEDAQDIADRFASMISWENSEHPIAVWQIPHHGRGIDGINLLTLNPRFADEYLNNDLRHALRACGFDFNADWSKLTNSEAVKMLRHSVGIVTDQPISLQHGYVLTIDNLLKMLSVSFRLKYGLPAIVMGETGCGKSSLMRSMCAILTWRLYTLNIHGGMTDTDIIAWMGGVLATIEAAPDKNMFGQAITHVIFLDEVNTCNCMGLFNEIICDRTMDGTPIPEHIRIVAACNPYRLRMASAADDTETGLVFDLHDENADAENVGTGIKDPLSELVYRVHPLPESMTDHVFDFGALSDTTEELYIKAMVRSMLKLYLTEEATVEDLSADDQIDDRMRRLGIEVVDGMSRDDKMTSIRLKMREMVVEEARKRAGAAAGGAGAGAGAGDGTAAGASAAAAPSADAATAAAALQARVAGERAQMQTMRARMQAEAMAAAMAARLEGDDSDGDDDDGDGDDEEEGIQAPGGGAFDFGAAGGFGAAPAGLFGGGFGEGHAGGLFGRPGAGMPGFGMAAAADGEEADAAMNERIQLASQEIMQEMQEADPFAAGGGRGGAPAFGSTQYQAKSRFGEFVDTFTELVCAAQEFVRNFHGGERSSASLRDVARCIKVYRWFGEHITLQEEAKGDSKAFSRIDFFAVKPPARRAIRDAVIMSIAYCYHSRLPRDARAMLRAELADTWSDLQVPGRYTTYGWYTPGKECCAWLDLSSRKILQTIEGVQKAFVQQMKFPEGIALNEALCENVFMMLVSVLNQIPIFVIGKPGTSKSLAMELVQTNLQGKASANDFLKSLPAVQKFSYQCSPLSTSGGIEAAFESARRYKMEAPNTIVVVLLDEVGLAEQSPHLPLKVLHKTLDEAKENESVVGISNWSLDPAKMNRAVHLYRPAPTVEDLALTAEGMVRTAMLKGYLQAIAEAFNGVYTHQDLADFWGMREFYSTVRSVNKCIVDGSQDGTTELSASMIMNSILRNYGGRPKELEGIIARFFQCLTMNPEGVPRASVVDLVKENIVEPDARHLMLLTKNNVALSMLFDYNILTHNNSTVIFGSDFPLDKTDLQIVLMLQRVKHCMANGVTLVLVHCEALYESMYDLLNQHYTEVGGQLWVRLAFGTHSRLCPIDPAFRVIVIVEATDAYTRLAPPLLNRFEKQVFDRADMVNAAEEEFIARVQAFARVFAARTTVSDGTIDPKATTRRDLKVAFCGFHADMVCSLCVSLVHEAEQQQQQLDWNVLFQEAVRRLLWTATPEAACRILQNPTQRATLTNEHNVDAADIYFTQQRHSNVYAFADNMKVIRKSGRPQMTMLMTHAPLFLGAANQIEQQGTWSKVALVVLHDLSSERDFQLAVDEFFENAEPGALLLVQCDPRAASLRRLSHAQYICEKAAEEFRLKHADFFVDEEAEAEDAAAAAAAEAEAAEAAAGEEGGGAAGTGADGREDEAAAAAAGAEGAVDKRSRAERDEDAARAEKDRLMNGGGNDAAGEAADDQKPEKARPKTIDVMFLVHLQRSSGSTFSVDFDNRWSYAFIDSITPASNHGLLDVEDMMGVTLSQMLDSDAIDLAKILAANFRFAMGRLVYLYERSNEDVRSQITLVLSYLQEASFIDTVQRHMLVMINEYELALDLSKITDSDSGLALVGTFQQALHRQFTDALSALFSVLLSHMDRNGALALFGTTTIRSLWLYLFRKSFRDMNILERRRFSMKTMGFTLEVKADGTDKKPFVSLFPFSFFLSDAFESMRESAETIGAKGDVADATSVALQRQFEMLGFEHGLSGELSADLLDRYVFDFAAMHMRNSTVFSKQEQMKLLWEVLKLLVPEVPITTLGQIHGRFWGCESRIALYSDLLDAVPAAIAGITTTMSDFSAEELRTTSKCSNVSETSAAADLLVLKEVCEHLEPGRQGWQCHDDYGKWCTQMDSVNAAVISLLSIISETVGASHPSVQAAHRQWEKLTIINQFVRDLAVPLEVEPATTTVLAEGLRATDLRTQTTFRLLVNLLCAELVEASGDGSDSRDGGGSRPATTVPAPVAAAAVAGRWEVELDQGWRPYMPADSAVIEDAFANTLETVSLAINGRPYTINLSKGHQYMDATPGRTRGVRRILPLLDTAAVAAAATADDAQAFAAVEPIVDAAKERAAALTQGANGLMEVYLDLCFSKQLAVSDADLLEDLVRVLAGKDLEGMPGLCAHYQNIISSEAGRVALLSSIVNIGPEALRTSVVEFLHAELWSGASATGIVDSPLAVTYLTVLERAVETPDLEAVEALAASLDLKKLKLDDSSVPIQDRLQVVAGVRRLTLLYANQICICVEPVDGSAVAADATDRLERLSAVIDPLLAYSDAFDRSLSRSMRMFLLKALERQRGVAFVRSVMQQRPVKGSPWMVEWLADNEVGLVRFMGANKLPQHNPFTEEELYPEAVRAVAGYLATGDLASTVELFLSEQLGNASAKSAFALGLFHEVGLLPVLADSLAGAVGPRVSALKEWLRTSASLDFLDDSERSILLFCAGAPPHFGPFSGGGGGGAAASAEAWSPAGLAPTGLALPDSPPSSDDDEDGAPSFHNQIIIKSSSSDDAVDSGGGAKAGVPAQPVACSAPGYEEASNFMVLDGSSSPEKILTVRLFAHLAARALSAEAGSQLHFFRLAMLNLTELADTKFPTMPDDTMYMVQRALMEAGASSGAKRWFTCPNGHPFAIGDCGGATVKARCPECNEEIGGSGHELLGTNRVLGGVSGGDATALFQSTLLEDKSEPNYCIGPVEAEDKFYTARTLSPHATRVVRALMHGCFTVGFCITGDSWVDNFQKVVNKDHVSEESKTAPGMLVFKHLQNDLALLKGILNINDEQVALLLHEVILKADKVETVKPAAVVGGGGGGGGGAAGAGAAAAVAAGAATGEMMELTEELEQANADLEELDAAAEDMDPDDYAAQHAELAQDVQGLQAAIAEIAARGGGGAAAAAGAGVAGGLFAVGDLVTVSADYASHADAGGGPVQPGEMGKVVEVQRDGGRQPIKVEHNGRQWWYMREALVLTAGGATHPTVAGQRVLLTPDGAQFASAVVEGRGLNPQEVGVVVECRQHRSKPWCSVKIGDGATSGGGVAWYEARALLVQGSTKRLMLPEKLSDGKLREQWESVFHKGVIDKLVNGDGIAERLREIEARFTDEDSEGAIFKEELLERRVAVAAGAGAGGAAGAGGGVGALATPHAAMPALWTYTRPFSFAHFEAAFSNTQENAELYPVLSAFLEKQSEIVSLKHMPSFFRYIDLVMERFDKSIDHEGARSMSVSDAMEKLTPQQQRSWDKAYSSFETVWNLSWHRVERFGCQEVPALYKGQVMSPATPIAFSLPGESDEAMCPFYLAQYLVDQHNDFVQRVDQALLMRRQDLQRHSTRVNEVSSDFMTEAHVLQVNMETEFAPYVLKQCVRYDADAAEAICDFGSAEKFLLDRYFRNKPLLNLRLRGFKYADDVSAGRNLGAKVAQVDLNYDVARRIKEELEPWPANALRALEILETCINFLTSASFLLSDTVGGRQLDSYLKDDLLMTEAELEPLGVVVRQQVKLTHLDSLVELLQAVTDQDPLEKVAVIYREDLDAPVVAALDAAAEHLDLDALLPVWRTFLLASCVSESISATDAIKNSLDWCVVKGVSGDDFMNEFDWFNDHFPLIELKYAVAAYKYLLERPA